MSVSDPVADYLTAIRNAAKAKKETVTIPASKTKIDITEILKEEKFISNYKILEDGVKKKIYINLRYIRGGEVSAIKGIEKVTKPSLQRYVPVEKIPKVLNGLGVAILSTNKGIISGHKAKAENVGGEVICKVW